MKKLLLIYNPFSGDRTFIDYLDECIEIFQNADYQVSLLRSTTRYDIDRIICSIEQNHYDAIVIAGGDGSINLTINALIQYGHDITIGILPCGTANDFASYLKLPRDIEAAANIIAKGHSIFADVGSVGDKYFINVCGAGFLTTVSQNVDNNLKSSLGKLAYYIKGLGELPNFVPLNVRITNSTEVFEEEIYFFIVLNSAGAGGFDKLSPNASINDGKFDFIAFKSMAIIDLALMFVKIFSGDYLSDPNIIFFQDEYIKIEPLFENQKYLITDTDGEVGPNLPIEINNLHNKIKIFI